ncbi:MULTISPECIES: long-chain-fatty-acid--CoA ligase [unclassified Aureimonas]|uniref:long-chain-fatty-acid--CoA ligase n=1 Tax=unclassified Aureimonas TaxID=2615206 RepID=UPI0006FD7C30|nr:MULTISPECIES: long-chain-fatty-acid--CoA ligase [unclassified Aureimonas]KQT61303.1 long-chain fatty acid--CoA ligase [Aureimonas sp. Leaf460]KQT68752.1 long-chain fatty acid--CoA ligase [Aureimonas sp. Leaf427]
MQGLMQHWPLLCTKVIDHAAIHHGRREVISRSVEGPIHRTDYASVRARALRLAKRLEREGIGAGDRVATMAWNTWRHLEAWYGIVGIGAIYHTLNPRLFPDQIAWIMNDAEDRLIFVDLTFLPILEKIAPSVPSLTKVVVLTDAAHMPETSLPGAVAYEAWLAEADEDFRWVDIDETAAAGLCYTSGTTGNPKGVLYSHRSNVLHSFIAIAPDAMNLSSMSRAMPVVPLFHANGWGIAFSCPMVGAAMVMPGPKMDGASIHELLSTERVTFTAAVPTVWLMLLDHLDRTGADLPDLKRVVIGGAACPRVVTKAFEERFGVEVVHAWGMTETSPLGTLNVQKPETADLKGEALLDHKQAQGQAPFGVEMRITDDENRDLPWDGQTFGRLKVRGPHVAAGYYGGKGTEVFDEEGWFDTGDVAHIDANGTMRITDRAKDVIKSGGEWISSIDLENLAVGHPDVAEAAVIGVAHPRWDERPLLVVVPKDGKAPTREALLAFLDGKIAKWWMPDDVAFVDELPHTATGKIQKLELRRQFKDYRLPTA